MSAVIIEDRRIIHYESFGRGQPVIFLHSWLGSWRYWIPSMEMIADRFRVYAFDFWGFGDSDRSEPTYSIVDYVKQLHAFMDKLGIVKANLVGHGLGGMIAVRAATATPDRFLKIIVSGMPVQGAYISELVKPSAISRLFGRANPSDAWNKLLSQIQVGDDEMIREVIDDTVNTGAAAIQQVVDSIITTDLRPDLRALANPTLGVYGENDVIVPEDHAAAFETNAVEHQIVRVPRKNHFPFLEDNIFSRLMLDFLTSEGTTQVQVKEEWKRRFKQIEYLRS